MRYRDLMETLAAQKPPLRSNMLDAIQHADVYGDRQWSLKDFEVRYLGYLTVAELGSYDDLSSWMDVHSPDDLRDFRQGEMLYGPDENMPPVIVITAPDPEEGETHLRTGTSSGSCHTQIGDGRGRINWANAHGARLHAYQMIYRGCTSGEDQKSSEK